MVWKNSTGLGIGFASGPGKDGWNRLYVVANYWPPGNFFGQFKKNVIQPSSN